MSREGRAGLGVGVISLALIALPPALDHFGLHLADRAWAALLVAGVLGLVVGLSLVIHAAWPYHLTLQMLRPHPTANNHNTPRVGEKPAAHDCQQCQPVVTGYSWYNPEPPERRTYVDLSFVELSTRWGGLTSAQRLQDYGQRLREKWAVVSGTIRDVSSLTGIATAHLAFKDGFVVSMEFIPEDSDQVISMSAGETLRAEGRIFDFGVAAGFYTLDLKLCELNP